MNEQVTTKEEQPPNFGNTFLRAAMGFIMLSGVVIGGTLVGLGVLETYMPNASWMPVILILIAAGLEICIYGSTLHDPVYSWIREPKERREAWERRQNEKAKQR